MFFLLYNETDQPLDCSRLTMSNHSVEGTASNQLHCFTVGDLFCPLMSITKGTYKSTAPQLYHCTV